MDNMEIKKFKEGAKSCAANSLREDTSYREKLEKLQDLIINDYAELLKLFVNTENVYESVYDNLEKILEYQWYDEDLYLLAEMVYNVPKAILVKLTSIKNSCSHREPVEAMISRYTTADYKNADTIVSKFVQSSREHCDRLTGLLRSYDILLDQFIEFMNCKRKWSREQLLAIIDIVEGVIFNSKREVIVHHNYENPVCPDPYDGYCAPLNEYWDPYSDVHFYVPVEETEHIFYDPSPYEVICRHPEGKSILEELGLMPTD